MSGVHPDRKAPEIVVRGEASMSPERLDLFLANRGVAPSRAQARRWIDAGLVRLNGAVPPKAGVLVKPGDEVVVTPPQPEPARAEPEPLPLDIIYEDEALIVLNKPKGLVVHPAPGHAGGTLVNALLHHYPDLEGIGGVRRPGIVHRLDKDTSGLMVVAKTEQAHRALVAALKERRVKRVYTALVHGCPPVQSGTVDAPIGRHPVHRKRMAVVERGGRPAVTHFKVARRFGRHALLSVSLETGRTHQIRVHLAHIGFPVVGDPVYGPRRPEFFEDGQALHASELTFAHPLDGRTLSFSAPLPSGFQEVLRRLERDESRSSVRT